MNRYVVSGAVLGLLLTLTGIPSPAPASPSGTGEPGTIRVHREYGDGPVQFHGGVNRVLITFHGQKGDRVLLEPALSSSSPCYTVSLRGRSGTVEPWSDRFWRLPAGGRFTFDYRLLCSGTSHWERAQLVKVNLHPLPINNGSAVMLGSRKHGAYVNAGVVTVPKTGRVQIRPPSPEYDPDNGPWSGLYMRGAPRLDLLYWDQDRSITALYLEAGSPIANEQGEMETGPQDQVLVPHAGQQVILMPNENHRVRATRARTVPGTLDGAAVPVSADRRWQEVGVRFASDGDQWVTATVSGPLGARSLRSLAMVGPHGHTIIGLGQATRAPENLWHLPTAGRYRLMARTDPTHSTGHIALTTVREMDAELPTDGQPVAFTAQKPGDWVLATGHLADETYTLTAETTDATDWRVLANSEPFELCRSSFCDQDGTSAYLGPPSPSQSLDWLRDEGPWIFLVAFGPGQSGTISLRLTPTG